jgi:two-component system cell cycle sensor histidine kinase/response regulator CckA
MIGPLKPNDNTGAQSPVVALVIDSITEAGQPKAIMSTPNKTLRILHVEDSERDVALLQRHLKRTGYELIADRVDTAAAMITALETCEWDLVLCNYSMPHFNALAALAVVKKLNCDIPFIVISGTIGESLAVEAMRAGANDYLLKDNLARLVPAIERELSESENRRARIRAEEQLRIKNAAVEGAANAILITDAGGKIVWVNEAFTANSGYSKDEVLGRNTRMLKSGKQDDAFYKEMWETILAGKVWRNTLINRRKDGTLNHEDMTITPIRDAAGSITQFVAIKQDITKLEQALSAVQEKNEELASMTQQLWQASKLATMGELSASIAHELNNPLATVALRVENLTMMMGADDQQRRSLEIISQEVDRMANLVDDLLQFSRRSHRQISTVDLHEEIANSMEFVHYHLHSRKIQVVQELADPLRTIQADHQQLRQLFLNLLTNASDAMPDGGILTVRAKNANLKENDAVQIDFADTGDGIAAENLKKIWEPFFSTKAEGKGTGLGLAICRRIVEEHGGTIEIESETGHGTTIHMLFPATANGLPANLE